MRKKIKLDLYEMDNIGIRYFKFDRVKIPFNNKFVYGWRYTLDKKITDTQKEELKKYKNVLISTCHYRYAQELKYDVLVVMDKCIK